MYKVRWEMEKRSPRVYVALSPSLMQLLERWAATNGEKPATLATYLLRQAIEAAEARGDIPPPAPDDELLRQLSDRCGLPPEDIVKAIDQYKADMNLCGGG